MNKVIEGLCYSKSHEYVRVEGNIGIIGISDYAQHALGNVVYVDMPDVDDEVEAGEEFGAVESVKAASDLIAPVSGTVVEVNEALADKPGTAERRCLRKLDHQGGNVQQGRTEQPHGRQSIRRLLRQAVTTTETPL